MTPQAITLLTIGALCSLGLSSCATEAEKRERANRAALDSGRSKLPHNRPLPGEGGAQFGGALDAR